MTVVNFVIAGVLFGIATAVIAKALDFAMDYGHLLDGVRFRKATGIMTKRSHKKYTDFRRTLDQIDDFQDRLHYVDKFYWKIAVIEPSFTKWLCPVCMSVRLNSYMTIIAIAAIWTSWDMALIFALSAFVSNYVTITKI